MITCKSPRKVLLLAHHLADRVLPNYSSRFSRHDFTLPQLFACLVLREQQRQSYRGVEALLRDGRAWCRAMGMQKIPDHNTLCRAFQLLVGARWCNRLLDLLAHWARIAGLLGQTLAIDSTLYDTHHRSRHYEQHCRTHSSTDPAVVSARRSASAKRTPKLSLGADTISHLVLAAMGKTGMGSDSPRFLPLLQQATGRRQLRRVLADSGFGSETNHRISRQQLHVESWIKAEAGHPTEQLPTGRWRREMKRTLARSQAGKVYGQRVQAEAAMSMLKRNLGDAMRSRSAEARQNKHLLRVITHNVMIL